MDRPRDAPGPSPDPAGRNRRAARFFFEICDGFLVVLDRGLQAIELGERFLTVLRNDRTLSGVVARGKICDLLEDVT